MSDINRVILSGNLGNDPKKHEYDNGGLRTTFNLAVTRWDGVNKKEITDWYFCEAINTKAKFLLQYAKKGDFCVIEGQLRTSKWVEKDTQIEKQMTYIRVSEAKIRNKKQSEGEDFGE